MEENRNGGKQRDRVAQDQRPGNTKNVRQVCLGGRPHILSDFWLRSRSSNLNWVLVRHWPKICRLLIAIEALCLAYLVVDGKSSIFCISCTLSHQSLASEV